MARGQTLGELVKGDLSKTLTFKVDDTHRVNTDLVDNENNARYFVPVHYTGRVTKTMIDEEGNEYQVFDPTEQSFNLANIYYHYLGSAIEFQWKNNILPEMEMARYLLNDRQVVVKENGTIKYQASRFFGGKTEENERTIKGGNIAEQFDTWLLYALYGQGEKALGVIPGTNIDAGKLTGALQKFTALNLLGLNYVAGVANMLLGETLQTIESFANVHWGLKQYHTAIGYYTKNLPGIMGDIGSLKPTNIVTLLLREFNVLHDPKFKNLTDSKFTDLMQSHTLFFTNAVGEHSMQTKGLLAMLEKRSAYNSKGEDIGSMLSLYKVNKDGILEVDKSTGFDEKQSKWDNTGRREFESEVLGDLAIIHGEYSDLGRVAIQQNAITSMAYMFRKFVIPGFRRRWGSYHYSERVKEFQEGAYVSTAKFARRLIKNLGETKQFMLSREWAIASDLTRLMLYVL